MIIEDGVKPSFLVKYMTSKKNTKLVLTTYATFFMQTIFLKKVPTSENCGMNDKIR